MMNTMLLGAIVMASSVIGLFFLRFWRSTGDRFFLFFALSFIIDAVNRLALGPSSQMEDNSPFYYIIRLVSYGLILFAIYDKNRPKT